MEGEDSESEDSAAFGNKSVWNRILVVSAGAVMNVLTGIVCLAGARTAARVLGVIVAIVGAAGVIYNQIVLDSFNYFDFASLLLGISIVAAAKNKK